VGIEKDRERGRSEELRAKTRAPPARGRTVPIKEAAVVGAVVVGDRQITRGMEDTWKALLRATATRIHSASTAAAVAAAAAAATLIIGPPRASWTKPSSAPL
jgi:hypothetical protein